MTFPTRLSETEQRFLAFWSRFIEDAPAGRQEPDDQTARTITKPALSHAQGNQRLDKRRADSIRRKGWGFSSDVRAWLIGDRLYSALAADRESISKALGVPVEWKSKDQKHVIETLKRSKSFSGSIPEDHPDELRQYLADVLNRYINVFKPRLERLMGAQLSGTNHMSEMGANCHRCEPTN